MKMRSLILTTLFLSPFLAPLLAPMIPAARADVAIVEVRFGKEKPTKRIVIDLDEGRAPATVENFRKLARKRFYNGVAFHRAIPSYLVQTGDPLSKRKDRTRVGTGGPGYTLPAEIHKGMPAGSVAMGRLPDKTNPAKLSSGSQFFIVLKDAPELSGQYTVFGKVIEGLEVAEAISKKNTDTNDYPIERIVVRSVKIAPAAPPLPEPKAPKAPKPEKPKAEKKKAG